MENNTVKRDKRKALPKFFLILLGAAVFGGVAALAFEQGACLHLRLFQTLHFGRRAADMKKQPEEKSGCYT